MAELADSRAEGTGCRSGPAVVEQLHAQTRSPPTPRPSLGSTRTLWRTRGWPPWHPQPRSRSARFCRSRNRVRPGRRKDPGHGRSGRRSAHPHRLPERPRRRHAGWRAIARNVIGGSSWQWESPTGSDASSAPPFRLKVAKIHRAPWTRTERRGTDPRSARSRVQLTSIY